MVSVYAATIDIEVTPEMLPAGLQVLVDSSVLDQAAGTELPTGARRSAVTDIYKAMARARHSDAAVQVTVPSVIEPGAELVVKNESDQPIRVVADPHETLPSRRANGRRMSADGGLRRRLGQRQGIEG
jgi:hypothetical protein